MNFFSYLLGIWVTMLDASLDVTDSVPLVYSLSMVATVRRSAQCNGRMFEIERRVNFNRENSEKYSFHALVFIFGVKRLPDP